VLIASQLLDLLEVSLPGINEPYLYFGMWKVPAVLPVVLPAYLANSALIRRCLRGTLRIWNYTVLITFTLGHLSIGMLSSR
jgi:hypothetical protein